MNRTSRGFKLIAASTLCGLAAIAATSSSSGGVYTSDAASTVIDKNATLRIGAVQVAASLDPHKESVADRKTVWQVWDRLTQVSQGSKAIVPAIAISWTSSGDGLTWTFKLRTNAKFHDGSPVTAADVKASITRAQTLTGSTAAPALSIVKSVTVVNAHTVRFDLTTKASYFPGVLATASGTVISAKALANGTDIATNPNDASSGPYIVKSFVPTQTAVLDRAPGTYWDPKAAQVKEFQITAFGSNDTAAINALLTGKEDLINVLSDYFTVHDKVKDSKFVHYAFKTAGLVNLFLNATQKPLDDIRVRQAIVSAVNRQKLATGLALNQAYYAPQGVTANSPNYVKGFNPLNYNVARAKTLLTQAGLPNGFTLTLLHPAGFAPAANSALVIQQDLAQVGIKVNITPLAPADFTPKFSGGTQQAAVTASTAFLSLYQQIADINARFNGLDPQESAKVQAALDKAAIPQSPAKERAANQALLKAELSQSTWIPLMFRRGQYVAQPYVLNVQAQPWARLNDTGQDPRYLAVAKH